MNTIETVSRGAKQDEQPLVDAELVLSQGMAEIIRVRDQLQTLLNGSTSVSIIAATTEGLVTVFNTGAERMLGYAAEEVVGKRTLACFHLESEMIARGLELSAETGRRVTGNDVFVEKARKGQPEEREWTYVRKDGSHLTVNLAVSSLLDMSGRAIGFLGVAMDVSARRVAENRLRASEERFRLMIDAVEDYALLMLDAAGCVVSWNTGAERMKGYTAGEIIGKHFSCFYPPRDVERGHPGHELRLAVQQGRYAEEGWRVRKDGSLFWADVLITAIYDDAGELRGFAKVTRDITQRRNAEAMLRKSEQYFQLLVDSVEDYALLMLDVGGHVITWNAGAERMNGYMASEIVGKHFSCFYLPEAIEKGHPEDELRLAVQNGRLTEEGWRVRKDGSHFWAEVIIGAVCDDNGKLRGFAKVTRDLTKRTLTEKSLHDQAVLLDLANDAILIRDDHDRITYWNQGAQRLYGFTKDEAICSITHDLLKTQFPQPPRDIDAQLLAQGHWQVEMIHARRDGSLATVASAWTVQRDEPNRSYAGGPHAVPPYAVLEMAYDITARKAAERHLERNEARTRAILTGAVDGIVLYEAVRDAAGALLDLQFVMINPAAERLLEVNASELIGQSARQNSPTAVCDGLFDSLKLTVESGATFDSEYVSRRFKTPRWFRMMGVKLGDGVVLSFSDVTARKRDADQLSTLVRRLGLATDALKAGVWDLDVRDNSLVWDERMYEIYGVPSNTPLDYSAWTKAVVPEDLASAEATLQTVIASKSQGSADFRIQHPDGSLRFIQAAEGAILDEAGRVVRVVGINIDTTGRKFNEDLERQVEERTAQLKAANIELEGFAYVASHDLKAPLRVIDNASYWLEEDLEEHLTDDARENLNLLRGRVRRMDKLLDDLLEYARIGRSADNRYAEIVNGEALIDDVMAMLASENFTVSAGAGFRGIQVCRMPLQQIFMNLIGNAIKHHDKKSGSIQVTVEDDGDYYAFAVQDDGPGIPAQFHDQIFKMFQTLKPRDKVEGSGIGLAMVRKNVEVFGGSLQLESAEGQGSLFRFTWPKRQQLKRKPE